MLFLIFALAYNAERFAIAFPYVSFPVSSNCLGTDWQNSFAICFMDCF